MRFRCPFCFYAVTVDDSARGYKTLCPSCSRELLVPVSRFQEGCIIGDFLIKSKIGEGAIGSVYLATQLSLERQVALKILSPEYTTTRGIKDFLKEARAAATLNHINLIQSYAIGEEDNICYMAMTYISGGSVKDRLNKEKKLPVDESLHIIQQAAEALHYVWQEKAIVHRDVKPDNIMITGEGIVKLTDLGLAIDTAEWREDSDISGSPSYMSPELFTGAKPDTRCDIYSLGVTLYQMLSGKLPFEARSIRSLAYQHMEEDAPSLDKTDPDIPPAVARLVKKMMTKDPANRYQDMDELLRDIWSIRQTTAPDRSLVPDVHTVSVRRLDYDIQKESIHTRTTVRKLEDEIRERRKFVRILVLLIPVAVMLTIITTLYWYGNSPVEISAESRLAQKIATFGRFTKDDTIPLKIIREEGDKIISEFGKPHNKTQTLMLESIQAKINAAVLRRTEIENRNLLNALRAARSENAKLRSELEILQRQRASSGERSADEL